MDANGAITVKTYLLPGASDPAKTQLSGAGLQGSTAGVQAQFTITAFDQFGNQQIDANNTIFTPKDSVTVSLVEAGPNGATVALPGAQIVYQGGSQQGVYVASYTLTKAALYSVAARLNGVAIAASAVLEVVPAATHPASCAVVGWPSAIVAGEATEFSVQARDQFGNDVRRRLLPAAPAACCLPPAAPARFCGCLNFSVLFVVRPF